VSLKDTGIGISDEHQKQLFQKFNQADSSIVRKYGGTGLGLAVCKELVEMMGGKIWVKSKLGEGSVFGFDIQLEKGESVSLGLDERSKPDLNGLKILVVDDNSEMRHVLENMLNSFSFEVLTASSGEKAIEIIKQTPEKDPVQLVIVDWKMPLGKNGIDTIKVMTNELKLKTLPKFILLSGYDVDDIIPEAKILNIDSFLNKPVCASMLYNTILDCFVCSDGYKETAEKLSEEQDSRSNELGNLHILLVEDNDINREIASEMLNQIGVRVSTVINGKEAVNIICNNENNFDMVFMDVQMPVMDVLTATKVIRSKGVSELPIIAMTAHALREDRIKSFTAGMNDHITKPILPEVLLKIIQKWTEVSDSKATNYDIVSEQSNEDFPEISGINTKIALTLLGNNEKLYKALLFKFNAECKKSNIEFKKAVLKENTVNACKILHTMKGNAGSIGALDLQRNASELENALKANVENIKPLLEKFYLSLETVISGLDNSAFIFNENNTLNVEIKNIGSIEDLKQLTEKIYPYIEVQNIRQSKELLKEFQEYCWPDEFNLHVDELCEFTSIYNFEKAKDALKNINLKLSGRDEAGNEKSE
jgi:CheY-like chemotaxis protein/HPt (histidine-containing phosphotransfer) domain-containing protein